MGSEAEGTGVRALFDTIEDLVRQGSTRRVAVTDRDGRTVLDLPVNAGLLAAVLAPALTAAGVALALVGGWHVAVVDDPDHAPAPGDE